MKMTKYFIVASMLLISAQSAVATDSNDLQRCSSIRDASKRLECFYSGINKPAPKKQNSSTELLVRKAVLDSLKDSDSAKFGRFTQATETKVCMTVNAREVRKI